MMQKFTMFCLALQPTDLEFGIIGREYYSALSLCIHIVFHSFYTDSDKCEIAENYMTGYRVVFDMENLKLGWSNSNCKYLCFCHLDLKSSFF